MQNDSTNWLSTKYLQNGNFVFIEKTQIYTINLMWSHSILHLLIAGSPGVPPAAINTVLKSNFELNRSGTEDLMAEEKIEKMSDQEKQEWFDKTREQKILNREQGRVCKRISKWNEY